MAVVKNYRQNCTLLISSLEKMAKIVMDDDHDHFAGHSQQPILIFNHQIRHLHHHLLHLP